MSKILFKTASVEVLITGVLVEGITHKFAFNEEKLKEHSEDIKSMLSQLPKEFFTETGGGYSFLCACEDANGRQWTGLHAIMESLFCMGIGIGVCRYLIPREMWRVFPGGVPYIEINLNGFHEKEE